MKLNNKQLLQVVNTLEAKEIDGVNSYLEMSRNSATVYILNNGNNETKPFYYCEFMGYPNYYDSFETWFKAITDCLNKNEFKEIHKELDEQDTREFDSLFEVEYD